LGEKTVLFGERDRFDEEVARHLERSNLRRESDAVELSAEELLYGLGAEINRRGALLGGVSEDGVRVRHDYREEIGTSAVAIEVYLLDERALRHVHPLEARGGDVLSLRELEDDLCPIDPDEVRGVLLLDDVARLEKTLFVEEVLRKSFVLVIAR